MSGSQFYGMSGGNLASIATSGMSGPTGGPSCGSAGAGRSPYVCGQPNKPLPSVTSQPYIPGPKDIVGPNDCISSPT